MKLEWFKAPLSIHFQLRNRSGKKLEVTTVSDRVAFEAGGEKVVSKPTHI